MRLWLRGLDIAGYTRVQRKHEFEFCNATKNDLGGDTDSNASHTALGFTKEMAVQLALGFPRWAHSFMMIYTTFEEAPSRI